MGKTEVTSLRDPISEGTSSLGPLEVNHEVRFTRQRKCRRGAGLPEVASSLSPGPQGFVSLLHAKYTCARPRSLKASPRLSAPSPEFVKSGPGLEESPRIHNSLLRGEFLSISGPAKLRRQVMPPNNT